MADKASKKEQSGFNEVQTMFAMSVDDAYRVERVLARSAQCVTELVTIDGSGPFVRKRIPSDRAQRNMWAALSMCRCPYLPRVRATYEMPDQFIVVCDYVVGETLEQAVAQRGALQAAEAVRLVSNLCDAVSDLHAHGIIHCDISPSNVVVSRGEAHLIDLGIARMAADEGLHDAGSYGTWGFAAPEQYGFAKVDARSDVYALGRLLGFMLTGARPDDAGCDRAPLDRAAAPSGLRHVIERASAFEPSARYQTVEELARELRALGRGSERADGAETVGIGVRSDVGKGGSRTAAPTRTKGHGMRASRAKAIGAIVLAGAIVGAIALMSLLPSGGLEDLLPGGAVDEGQIAAGGDTLGGAGGEGAEAVVSQDGGSGLSGVSAADAADVLEVAESWWGIDDGFVVAVVGLKNTSDTQLVEFPRVSIVGRDADGRVLFTSSALWSAIRPGETLYESLPVSLAEESGALLSVVEFEPIDPGSSSVAPYAGGIPDFKVENATAIDRSGSVIVTGDVVAVDAEELGGDVSGAVVTAIVRDGSGAIVGGGSAGVEVSPSRPSAAFEILVNGERDYATVDVRTTFY